MLYLVDGFCFFETWLLCVALELTPDYAVLNQRSISLFLLSAEIKGEHHHCPTPMNFSMLAFNMATTWRQSLILYHYENKDQ